MKFNTYFSARYILSKLAIWNIVLVIEVMEKLLIVK